MLDALRNFLANPEKPEEEVSSQPPVTFAAAALLVEAAMADGTFDVDERLHIEDVLSHLFSLSEEDIAAVVEDAQAAVVQSNQLYGFAKTCKDTLDYDRRLELMQVLWEVVYADGQLDDFEANLVRRVNGLLYVTDQDSGSARKAALEQLGLDPETSA